MARRIAIALGEVRGIGPEVALKAVAAELAGDEARYLFIGDPAEASSLNRQLGLQLDLVPLHAATSFTRVAMVEPNFGTYPHPALDCLADGAARCLRGEAAALITAPVNKEAIIRAGVEFVGQTEFLSEQARVSRTIMMLLGPDERERWLRVALVTTHLALKEVAAAITAENVVLAIQRAAEACRDLGLARAHVGVCGLNPHAGEGGKFGREEIEIIAPAVAQARLQGIDVSGPWPADTLFHHALRGDYDAVVAMYHDQGLVPLKMVAFENGVNWTLGLPFIRTSPDHGTAYDIAGRGVANPSSMIAAIRLAKQLAARRA